MTSLAVQLHLAYQLSYSLTGSVLRASFPVDGGAGLRWRRCFRVTRQTEHDVVQVVEPDHTDVRTFVRLEGVGGRSGLHGKSDAQNHNERKFIHHF